MNDAGRPRSLQDLVAGWNSLAQQGMRHFAIALASVVASYAGAATLETAPWAALALPAGLALAAMARWGRSLLVAVLAGLLVALLGMERSAPETAYLLLAVGVACIGGDMALHRMRFDRRLERARDVAALICALAVVVAMPATLLTAFWVTAVDAHTTFSALLQGWLLMSIGMTCAVLPALTIDRRLFHRAHPSDPWWPTAGAALSVTLLWAVLWRDRGSMADPSAWVLPTAQVLLVALVLRGHLAIASAGLLGAALLAAAASQQTPPLGDWMVWTSATLALVLGTHTAAVSWLGRTKRWEWALDGTRLGVADWRLDDSTVGFASAAWRTLTGHSPSGWRPADWIAETHPEDRSTLEQAIASLTSGAAGRVQAELRLIDPTGGWRWAEATLLVIERDGHDKPTRLLATLSDVHERREALERKRMSASLFQHLHEGLLITDLDLRALDVNPAYTQILGVSRDELLGTVPSLLRPAPADPIARQQRAAMWSSLRETGSWRGELFERRRNGEICTLQSTISTVPGPTHDLGYHVLVISDITEQRVQREQLERQAHFDELTRLPNRARLSQLLDDAMRAADRDGYLLAVCYLDLDRFKPVNDRHGHAAGDRLLAELAGRLRSALRRREHWADSAARLGGDEFVLLLRAGTLEEARLAVERVLRVVALPYVIDPAEGPVQVTASMGATVYPIDRSDADTLLRHADHAMYGAKQAGRNGYLFFDPEHRRRTEARVMAIGRVQEALDQQEFILYYQPKVDMRTGHVHGFEALLRWEHPQQGLMAPMQFLPLIENTGLSSRVGDWVLAQALDHLAAWRRHGLDISVSVNISARHLQEPDFALRLSELLARHAEPLAPFLELEMLETAAHADIESTSALLGRCQALGVRFALDDFGTGYSTLTYLKRLPVDVLKIDRSFVHHMLDDTQDRAIVEGVIGLAGTFGCVVVAEGVESPAQARTLLELGCQIGQGTGIAAPMPSDQVVGWVRDYRGMFALVPADGPADTAPAVGTGGVRSGL